MQFRTGQASSCAYKLQNSGRGVVVIGVRVGGLDAEDVLPRRIPYADAASPAGP